VVKKTIAIHPVIDKYVRETWAALIKAGYDATYSAALNFMLLIAIMETITRGWSRETAQVLQSFLRDEKTIEELGLAEQLSKAVEYMTREIIENARRMIEKTRKDQ
jgi:hypothetical protein